MSSAAQTLHALQTVSRSGVASLTVVVWGIMTTWDEEVALVWNLRNTSWIKWAYLWNRYYALIIQILIGLLSTHRILHWQRSLVVDQHRVLSHRACTSWFQFRALHVSLQLAFVQPVLIARVRALYNCNRLVTTLLLVLYVAQLVNLLVLSCTVLPHMKVDFTCFPPNNELPRKYYLSTLTPPLALESIMLGLTVYKMFTLPNQSARPTFLTTVLRDGMWAFFLIFLCVLVNELLQITQSGPMMWVGVDWVTASLTFACSRLILNMLQSAVGSKSTPDHIQLSRGGGNGGQDPAFTSHARLEYELDIFSVDDACRPWRNGERRFCDSLN